MITKVSHTANLRKTVNYVYQSQKDATVVGGNSIREEKEQVYAELKASIDRRADIKRPVFHAILSLPKEEEVTPEQWGEIADEYMEKMGYGECSWVAVEHHDTDHNHVHIVASRIDWSQKRVRDSYEKRRSEKVARELEVGHGLKRLPNSWEVQKRRPKSPEYHRAKRTGEPSVRVRADRIVTNKTSRRVDEMSPRSGGSKRDVAAISEGAERQRVAMSLSGLESTRPTKADPAAPPRERTGGREGLEGREDRDTKGERVHPDSGARRDTRAAPSSPKNEEGVGASVAPKSSRLRIKSALQVAKKDAGWKAWADSLREREVEPVPRVAQADRAKIIGMYFEHKGETHAGSAIDKNASFKALERRLGAWNVERDAGAFRSARAAGVGRVSAPGRAGARRSRRAYRARRRRAGRSTSTRGRPAVGSTPRCDRGTGPRGSCSRTGGPEARAPTRRARVTCARPRGGGRAPGRRRSSEVAGSRERARRAKSSKREARPGGARAG